MPIPPRLLKSIAQPNRFAELDQVTYVGAVALAANPADDPRLDVYVRYFKAEQEEDGRSMERIFSACEDPELRSLLDGRRLLQQSSDANADAWLETARREVRPELQGYVYFLAGIASLKDTTKSSRLLNKSALEYARAGKSSRELQSILQDPELNSGEINYLRAHAREGGDLKSFHVAGLSLATRARKIGDIDEARRHARESARAFRDEFLDPRRERISASLLSEADPLHLTALEARVLRRLERGACAKAELLRETYGDLANYACRESIDARFRTLLSRLNKKLGGAVVNHEGRYQLRV